MTKNRVIEKHHGDKELMSLIQESLLIKVGIQGSKASEGHKNSKATNVEIGTFHEFGLGVPKRSFIRDTFDENIQSNKNLLRKAGIRILDGKGIRKIGELLGLFFVGQIQERIASGIPPELAESTKKRKTVRGKSGDTPLIDTGQLRSSITHKIEVKRMNPTTIQTQLEAFVTAITASQIGAGDGLPSYWQRSPAGFRRDHALLWIGPVVGVGGDDIDYEVDLLAAAGEEITHYQMGQRQFPLQIQIWSYSSDPSKNAREYCRRIRDRLWLDDWDATLLVAEIGIQGAHTPVDLSGNIGHGRETSAAQIDVVFNSNTNESGAAIGYIATVEFETNFLLPDGTPASEQFTGDIEVG